MELVCTTCRMKIDSADVNISTDLAKCGHCGAIHRASSLVPAIDSKTLATPPVGSKIEIIKGMGDSFQIFMPKKGIDKTNIPFLAFCIIWFSFIAFWTWGASLADEGQIMALFSIPFWIIGFVILTVVLNKINETQTIEVTKTDLTIVKTKPIMSKRYEYSFKDIQLIKITELDYYYTSGRSKRGNINNHTVQPKAPAIITGSGTKYFFEQANEAEKIWVTNFLDAFRQTITR